MAAMSITQPIYKATPVLEIPHKWRLVDSEIRRRFLTSVSANLIVTPGRSVRPGILFGREWREWSQRYVRLGYHRSDPAVRMLRDQTRPFTWTEARTRHPSTEGEQVMNDCRDHTGCAEGFVVPVRETDGALLSAAFCGPALDLEPAVRPAFHLAGYYYATRGREILNRIELDPVCPLSPRQLECLRWVHAGKTDGEIGCWAYPALPFTTTSRRRNGRSMSPSVVRQPSKHGAKDGSPSLFGSFLCCPDDCLIPPK